MKRAWDAAATPSVAAGGEIRASSAARRRLRGSDDPLHPSIPGTRHSRSRTRTRYCVVRAARPRCRRNYDRSGEGRWTVGRVRCGLRGSVAMILHCDGNTPRRDRRPCSLGAGGRHRGCRSRSMRVGPPWRRGPIAQGCRRSIGPARTRCPRSTRGRRPVPELPGRAWSPRDVERP